MTHYRRGARLEYEVCADLRKRGFTAQRSAGSHSPVDVFAVPDDRRGLLFVQAKLGRMSRKEREAFFDFCQRAGAEAILASKKDGRLVYSIVTSGGEIRPSDEDSIRGHLDRHQEPSEKSPDTGTDAERRTDGITHPVDDEGA